MEHEISRSDEEYVVNRAKCALKDDPIAAKAWMITAKTMFPNNFGVQFEAYKIEKSVAHVKEAAKCFSDLIGKFQQQPEFWMEITNVTLALRAENDDADPEKMFLCEMFKHISLDVQHKLLLLTADNCEDTQEHCKLLLLLLQRFPSSISTHGPGLVETLLSAEKHSVSGNLPINCYRKLLVCDLLPLLNSDGVVNMELPPKLVYKLLHKSIEYYVAVLQENMFKNKDATTGNKSDDSWNNLFSAIAFSGKQLGWAPYLINFTNNWCKDTYWQKLLSFYQSQNFDDPNILKQLVYCLTILLLYCLYNYTVNMYSDDGSGQPTYVMVEAFTDINLPTHQQHHDPKAKKRKSDGDITMPLITGDKPLMMNLKNYFILAVKCWDLLHSSEFLSKEFYRLSAPLTIQPCLSGFMVDYLIFKGKYEEALKKVDSDNKTLPIVKSIVKANIYYLQSNFLACFDFISEAVTVLPPTNLGAISTQLVAGGKQRHMHYLPLCHIPVLQFLSKMLLHSIKQSGLKDDMSLGHSLVLMQMDWPQEEDYLPPVIEEIKLRRTLYYFLFQNYITQIDILEELAYLSSPQGGQVTLEIVPNMITRRIGTRGSDKGMKEEIKQALRRQITRCNEPVHELIYTFLVQERQHIAQILI